ncbi:MAG TPA: M48 family metallopeptidase [Candidatus Eisenbacteria bacterium]|nr:M48 family metallopeptidase [Candidatus Eisenbacteria bacterium]
MPRTFRDLIGENRRRSVMLVIGFLAFFTLTIYAFAVYATQDAGAAMAPAVIGLGVGGILALWSYRAGAGAILAMSGAKPIQKEDDPQLWNVVEELTIAAGVPMPRIYLINDTAMNAFATGRGPRNAVVAITKGLRDRLNRDELQGVLAHEMSHVRNYDIRFAMLLAVMVGLLALVADGFRRSLWWGGGRRRSSDRDGGAATAVFAILAIVLSMVAPLIGKLIQLAASREREYLADASAIELTRNPEGLASALEKLGSDQEVLEVANRATQHLYIVNPFKPFETRAKGLLSTHPPLEERIRRIRELSGTVSPIPAASRTT